MSERLKINSGKAILAKCFFVTRNLFVGLETMTQGRWNGRKTIQIWVEIMTATKIKANTMVKYWEQHDSSPTPCENLQCIIVQKQFGFRGTTANSKIVHLFNPPPPHFCKKSLNQRSWKSWLWMGDYIFTEDTYAKIQIIKIACSCHDLAPYLTLLKVICLISLPQLFPHE